MKLFQVRYWITFDSTNIALPSQGTQEDMYKVIHNIIRAHIKTYQMYKSTYSYQQGLTRVFIPFKRRLILYIFI